MLTYAFDLLYAIYEEEGYDARDIPGLILSKNLYGVEIDKRAGALAAFALFMKAREKSRRFFRQPVQPNICVLQKVSFEEGELVLNSGKWGVGSEKRKALFHDLNLFEEADNFGSLLRPVMEMEDIEAIQKTVHFTLSTSHSLFEHTTMNKVKVALEQASYLSPRYHVVIANPPYMGGKGMNGRLASYLKDNYPDVKSDLFSAFIIRNTELALPKGQLGFMTPFVWMFISSYEKLRLFLIDHKTITSLIQLEYSGFDGATVPICTFTIENAHNPTYKGGYVRLSDFKGAAVQGPKALEIIQAANRMGK